MQLTLEQIADLVSGQLSGDPQLSVTGANTLRDAEPGEITLAEHSDLARQLGESRAAAVIVPRDFEPSGIPFIAVGDVHAAFAAIVSRFRPPRPAKKIGVSAAAHVSHWARLAEGVEVHPGAFIGDDVTIGAGSTIHHGACIMAGCRIGENATIFPGAVLYENTEVGDRVTIHAGAVIGAFGFGYRQVEGQHQLSAQLGNVILEDDVEIGAGATIDRGTYGATRIGAGTKIDNQVQVAHNCRIGRHNLLCAQVGIAGSTVTGDYVVMAGQVGVRDHVQIGQGAVLGAMSGIMHDVPEGARLVGIPATPEREQMQKQAAWAKLPAMRREFKNLVKRVQELEEQLADHAQSDAA